MTGRVDGRRRGALLGQRAGCAQQAVARLDDAHVGGGQVFLGAIHDRPGALLQRCILHGNAGNTAVVALGTLRRTIHQVVVGFIGNRAVGAGDELGIDALGVLHRGMFFGVQIARRMMGEGPGPAVLVIDRHPGMAVQGVIAIGRNHLMKGHDPLRHTPVGLAFIGIAPRTDQDAGRCVHDFNFWFVVALVLRALGTDAHRLIVEGAAVQPGHMCTVDAAFHGLHVIVFLPALIHVALRGGHCRPFEVGCRWLMFRRPHVGPDHTAALDTGVAGDFDTGSKLG